MSFSREVKEELVRLEGDARHCQIAELAAMLIYSRAIRPVDGERCVIEFQSDFSQVTRKCVQLLRKIFSKESFFLDKEAEYEASPPGNIFRYEGSSSVP